MYLQMAFKQRPLRDGGGKPSLGRLAPWARPLSKAAVLGARICVLTSPWGDKLQESLSLGEGSHPFPEDLLEDIGDSAPNTLAGAHFWRRYGGGPLSKEAAASRCGCASADLCSGPLAGIDEGDKIRTIYDGSVGGANDTMRNQTVERTTAPTVLDGVQAYMRQPRRDPPLRVPLAPRGGSSNLHLGAVWPEPGTRWVLLKADVTKAHWRVKVLRKDWWFHIPHWGKNGG